MPDTRAELPTLPDQSDVEPRKRIVAPLCAPALLVTFDRHGPLSTFRDPGKLRAHLAGVERRGLHVGRYVLVDEWDAEADSR